jgi:lipopolysaccharide cholinephosphotransferase
MQLQDIQSEEASLLSSFDGFCTYHDITYYLAYGSLLGAVRNQSPIPWDDDTDVLVPRTDYERLRTLISKAPAGTSLLTPDTVSYPWPWMKLISTRTYFDEPVLRCNPSYYGVFIDIFPLDNILNKADTKRYNKVHLTRRIYDYSYVVNHRLPQLSDAKEPLRRVIGAAGHIHSRDYYLQKMDSLATERSSCKSEFVANFYSPYSFDKECIEAADCEGYSFVDYSGHRIRTFKDPVKYLERVYGPTWRTPIKREAENHGTAYWR